MKPSGVRLRPVEDDDLRLLERIDTDPSMTEPFEWRGFRDSGRWRRRWELDRWLGEDDGVLVVAVDDGACAGFVSWRWVVLSGPRGCLRVGIVLFPEHRGHGVGTAAQRLLVDYLFDFTTVNRIEAATEVENVAEQRALERAGFTQEGLMRGGGWGRGQWRDGYLYARLRSDPQPDSGVTS